MDTINFRVYEIHIAFAHDHPARERLFWQGTLRGAIGHELYTRFCYHPLKCGNTCQNPEECLYEQIFGSQPGNDRKPWVLSSLRMMDGQNASIRLVTFRKPEVYSTAIMEAIACAGKRGIANNQKFEVLQIFEKVDESSPSIREEAASMLAKNGADFPVDMQWETRSPLHLTHHGTFQKMPDTKILLNAAYRRLADLSLPETETDTEKVYTLPANFFAYKTTFRRIEEVFRDRYSTRQKRSIRMTGIEAQVYVENTPLWAFLLLKMAGIIHMGKYSVFGFGNLETSLVEYSEG